MLKTAKLLTIGLLLWANIIGASLAYRFATSEANPVWLTPQQVEDISDVLP